jgi:putative hemolysin
MGTGLLTEVAIILGLLLCNGVFAMSEIAVVTSRAARLEGRASQGDPGARAVLALLRDPTRFLSTVQIGITLIGTVAGAFGGAAIAEKLAATLEAAGVADRWGEPLAFGVVVFGITFTSLVVGELVPKRVALTAPERIAELVARPMGLLARIGAPAVFVLTKSTEAILALLRVKPRGDDGVTEDDLRALVTEATRSGVMAPTEGRMVSRIFRLGDLSVRALATPRGDLDWIDVLDPPTTIAAALGDDRAPAVLVCRGQVDEVIGVATAADLLALVLQGRPLDGDTVAECAHAARFVPAHLPAHEVVEALADDAIGVAVVLDEFGGVVGVVDRRTVLRALAGREGRAGAGEEPSVVVRPEGGWLIDGLTALPDVAALLGVDPGRFTASGAETLGGYVMARLGRVPQVAEVVDDAGITFEVVDMDGRRVDKVLVRRRTH